MDEERANDLTYDTPSGSKRIPRELPDTPTSDANSITDEPEEIKGHRARVQTRIMYDDSLTKEQWIDSIDYTEDTPEDAAARKRARIRRRPQVHHKEYIKGCWSCEPMRVLIISGRPAQYIFKLDCS
jgi:hypothetical protein